MMRPSRLAATLGILISLSGILIAGEAAAAPSASCRWTRPTALPIPPGFTAAAVGATDGESTFAGSANTLAGGSFDFRAVVWQGGLVSLLPTPDGVSSQAAGMNRLGDVVGFVVPTAGGTRKPALWRAGALIQLATASSTTDA